WERQPGVQVSWGKTRVLPNILFAALHCADPVVSRAGRSSLKLIATVPAVLSLSTLADHHDVEENRESEEQRPCVCVCVCFFSSWITGSAGEKTYFACFHI
ncbi:unnamed protein product, partial [Sphacelaria rigidula]